MFESLFKYRAALFSEGEFAFRAPNWQITAVVAVLLVLLVLVWRFRPRGGEARPLDTLALVALRWAAIALLAFCLLQPSLVLESVVPQESFVGLVVDDSKSMRIADGDNTRADEVSTLLSPGSPFADELSKRFKVRSWAFSEEVRRIERPDELRFAGGETEIGAALERAAGELDGTALAGLVLLSDGADSSDSGLSETLLSLRSRGIPVHTVGFGRERFDADIEVTRVVAPRRVLRGSSLMVEVSLAQRGYAGETVRLEVEDEGRIVSVEDVTFPTDGEAVTARVDFTVEDEGVRSFRFRVPPRDREAVSGNNEQYALIEVLDRKEKILYFEGEPRFELKFLRRAVEDDENLQLVCLQRTAENKFLRLDIDSPDELAGGFPVTREELFAYRGLILGSVEASFFTYDQLRMIHDFVSQRGGGLLMLGGRRSFSEGGYVGTPIADVLPVELAPAPAPGTPPSFASLDVALTSAGREHPALRLASDDDASAGRWAELPALSTFNPISRVKAGATTLLEGSSEALSFQQVVLAQQRFGRGRALAFTPHDSWMWQMHSTVPLEDLTHETLWRQLMRWLVSYVPDPVTVSTDKDRVAPGRAVEVRARVRDLQFLEVNGARVSGTVRAPSGEESPITLEWAVEEDGLFRAPFTPTELGLYRVELSALSDGETLGNGHVVFETAELPDEFFGAEQQSALLTRIAEETGGSAYAPERVTDLVEDLSYGRGGSTVEEYRDLWDMPILFLLLAGLLCGEWLWRQQRRLA